MQTTIYEIGPVFSKDAAAHPIVVLTLWKERGKLPSLAFAQSGLFVQLSNTITFTLND